MLPLVWTPYSDTRADVIMPKLESIFQSWRGTPFRSGQQCKGYGVDCVRFACAVMDELDGKTRKPTTIDPDASISAPAVSSASLEEILKLFFPYEEVTDGTAQPGDILATGPKRGGPGHALIVGTQPGIVWESTVPYVRLAGWSLRFSIHNRLFKVIRLMNRSQRWVTQQ